MNNRNSKGQFIKGQLISRADVTCVACGRVRNFTKSAAKNRKYCSMDCSYKAKMGKIMKNKGRPLSVAHRLKLSGVNANNWQGGISSANEIARKRVEYRIWAKAIKERDNFECQICGEIGGYLHSNHIKKFCDYPELRYVLGNGITICKNCDLKRVMHHESEWESYFNFNLLTRSVI